MQIGSPNVAVIMQTARIGAPGTHEWKHLFGTWATRCRSRSGQLRANAKYVSCNKLPLLHASDNAEAESEQGCYAACFQAEAVAGNSGSEAGGNPEPSVKLPWKPKHPIQAFQCHVQANSEPCVNRCLELANKKESDLKQVATPCIDDRQLVPESFEKKCAVALVACKIMLKEMYVTRFAMPYFLWSVNTLARVVAKWTGTCDRRLRGMISYIHQTKDCTRTCWVEEKIEDCRIMLFCVAGHDVVKINVRSHDVRTGPIHIRAVDTACRKASGRISFITRSRSNCIRCFIEDAWGPHAVVVGPCNSGSRQQCSCQQC